MSADQALDTAPPAAPMKVRFGGSLGTGLMLVAVWATLIIATTIHRADFFTAQTLLAIAFTMSIVGVLAIGQGIIGMSGGFIDLSQPAGMITAGLVAVRLSEAGMPFPVVILGAIITGMLWGGFNALIIVFAKLNPVIVTLATNFIGLAALYLVFQQAQVPLNSDIYNFGRQSIFGLPAIFWPMLALVLIVGFLVPRTRYGRRMIAVGGNRAAAKARGISLRVTRFATFIIAGGFVGFAAVLFAGTAGPFNPSSGNSMQLNIIAGVILAGISLAGGRGNFWMLLLSVGFLSTIPTSLVFFGLSSDTQSIFQGIILIIAVSIDGYRALRRTP